MLVAQWDVDHRPECGAGNEGYRALWAAVMKLTLEDYWKGISLGYDKDLPAKPTQTYLDFKNAKGWLFNNDTQPTSLAWVCDHLGYDIEFVRFKVRTRSVWREERIARNREQAAKNHETRKLRGKQVPRLPELPDEFTVFDVMAILDKKGTVARAWITAQVNEGHVIKTCERMLHPVSRRILAVYRKADHEPRGMDSTGEPDRAACVAGQGSRPKKRVATSEPQRPTAC